MFKVAVGEKPLLNFSIQQHRKSLKNKDMSIIMMKNMVPSDSSNMLEICLKMRMSFMQSQDYIERE